MKRRMMKKGFTLIEVCIASAILALAISPLIANFVQANKMNLRSRKDMNAMNLSHDILEGVSVYKATDLDAILSSKDGDGNSIRIAELLPTGTTYDQSASGGGLFLDGAGVMKDKRLYQYDIKSVKTVESPYNEYDVRITMDGREKDDDNNVIAGKYANKEFAKISTVDTYYDASFVYPQTEVMSVATELASGKPAQPEAYIGKIIRKMWVKIKNNGTDDNPNYSVTVDRYYYVDPAKYGGGIEMGNTQVLGENISKAESYVLPRNIYIYFEGMPGATSGHNREYDQIEVVNTTGKDVTVYLIRTIKQEASYSSETLNYNRDYGCDVKVSSKEVPKVDEEGNATGEVEGITYLVSNLRYNLTEEPENNFRVYKEGSSEYADNVRGTLEEVAAEPQKDLKYAGDSKYSSERATYAYDNTGTSSGHVTMNEATYSKLVSDGYQKNMDAAPVYKVTVEVFEAGTDNRVAIYTGGVVD